MSQTDSQRIQAQQYRAAAHSALAKAEELMNETKCRRFGGREAMVKLLNIQSNLLDALLHLELARDAEGR